MGVIAGFVFALFSFMFAVLFVVGLIGTVGAIFLSRAGLIEDPTMKKKRMDPESRKVLEEAERSYERRKKKAGWW